MYYKVKNTLASLAVAMTMLGLSYSVGSAPMAQAAAPRVDFAAPGIEAGLDRLEVARKRDHGIQSQLSMPFYSFAPLLPRRES
ncbi:MAG: hypothetical protein ABI588_07910 [Arenimonas sp.]